MEAILQNLLDNALNVGAIGALVFGACYVLYKKLGLDKLLSAEQKKRFADAASSASAALVNVVREKVIKAEVWGRTPGAQSLDKKARNHQQKNLAVTEALKELSMLGDEAQRIVEEQVEAELFKLTSGFTAASTEK